MFKKTYKRNEQIKKLSREHHFSLLFCWKIRQGLKNNVSAERIRGYVEYFWKTNLRPHLLEEEKLFFAPVNDHKVQKAIREHRMIRREIEGLSTLSGSLLRRKLEELADLVSNHIRYEERVLFPHLERLIKKEQFETIGIELERQKSCSLQDSYSDQFWNSR